MFLVFAGDTFYPAGGMNDCVGEFESLHEALACVEKGDEYGNKYGWAQVVTIENGKLVNVAEY